MTVRELITALVQHKDPDDQVWLMRGRSHGHSKLWIMSYGSDFNITAIPLDDLPSPAAKVVKESSWGQG